MTTKAIKRILVFMCWVVMLGNVFDVESSVGNSKSITALCYNFKFKKPRNDIIVIVKGCYRNFSRNKIVVSFKAIITSLVIDELDGSEIW